MANIDNPHGLSPVMSGNNAGSVRIRHYYASVTTAIGKGDVVVIATNGRVHALATATGSDYTRGVAASYHAAGVTPSVRIPVYDDPNTLFQVNSDGTTDPTAATAREHVAATANLVVTTLNTNTGNSRQELDYSDIGTDTTAPLTIDGLSGSVGNDPALAHGDYIVKLNRHIDAPKGARIAI